MPSTTTVATYTCDRCLGEVPTELGDTCPVCGDWCCDDCGFCCDEDYDEYSDSRIHEYDWRPRRYNPKGNYPHEPLLGVELEIGGDMGDIADVVESFDGIEDHLYMKKDGSIDGVEIVTHPMTLAYARGYQFGDMLGELRHARCYVNNGYGLHVHVSRNAFQRQGKQSASHQMMWLLFMYRNVDSLENLARRVSDEWASFRKPDPGELARKAQRIERDDRYVAVNCNNARTFELRFFASTLNEREFFAALEFADASVRYTRSFDVQDVLHGGALTWPHFTEWVQSRDYPNLFAEITR